MKNNDKKYLVPVEMDKEYAAKVGINPDEIKKIRLYGKITEVYFVEVADEKTYYELIRPIWREDKAINRNNRCMVSNGKGRLVKCEGKCENCEYRENSAPLSIDFLDSSGGMMTIHEGKHMQQDKAMCTEGADEIVENSMLIEMLYKCLDELTEENRTIIKMFSEGISESEIAAALNMTQPNVNYRKKKLLKELKKNFENFFY